MSLPGVTVIIGAASGIGQATAILFAKRGCTKIVIGDVNAQGLTQTKTQIQHVNKQTEVFDLSCDVTSELSVNHFISEAVSKFGRIDHACNIAGVLMPGSSPEFSAADFDKQFSINARGMWLCQRAEIIQMLKQEPVLAPGATFVSRGAIANVASMAALRAYDNLPSYCATKHAILGFTKADGLRYGADMIRVNAICPGVITTPLLGEISDDDTTNIGDMTKEMAMGRQGRPEEVAEALLWITSDQASFVTATQLAVNGGMIAA